MRASASPRRTRCAPWRRRSSSRWAPSRSGWRRRPGALYHAALANGANHLVTLVAQSADLLARAGVEHPSRLLGPLLSAALDNALRFGDAALTGPVARGDAGTVAAHVAEIGKIAPEAAAAYVAMARLTADRALAAGRLDPAAAEALLDVLSRRHPFREHRDSGGER